MTPRIQNRLVEVDGNGVMDMEVETAVSQKVCQPGLNGKCYFMPKIESHVELQMLNGSRSLYAAPKGVGRFSEDYRVYAYEEQDQSIRFHPDPSAANLLSFTTGQRVGVVDKDGRILQKMNITGFAVGIRKEISEPDVRRDAYEMKHGKVIQEVALANLVWLVGPQEERLDLNRTTTQVKTDGLTPSEKLIRPLLMRVHRYAKDHSKPDVRKIGFGPDSEKKIKAWYLATRKLIQTAQTSWIKEALKKNPNLTRALVEDPRVMEGTRVALGKICGLKPAEME